MASHRHTVKNFIIITSHLTHNERAAMNILFQFYNNNCNSSVHNDSSGQRKKERVYRQMVVSI